MTLLAIYTALALAVSFIAWRVCCLVAWADRALEEHFGRDDRAEGR